MASAPAATLASVSTPTLEDAQKVTIQPAILSDFSNGYCLVEHAAFSGGEVSLLFPAMTPETLAFNIASHERIFTNDPSAVYYTAKTPSGTIVGVAKWNFFLDSSPQHPWPTTHAPGANVGFVTWFFGALDHERNEGMKGKKHALMATLAIQPEWQKLGLGGRLLEDGLKRCDAEGTECWIDASAKGKGLYLKHGWVQCGKVDIELKRWGAETDEVAETACMVRLPKKSA